MASAVFDFKSDPRLEPLEKKAEQYAKDYPPLKAGATLDEIRAREKIILDKLVKDIGDTYGEYSMDTFERGNREEFRAQWAGEKKHLSGMEKGSLVCRHYAPILSYLADKAGVPNHLVSCHTAFVRPKEGAKGPYAQLEFVESVVAEEGAHATILTTQGNAFCEATVAGADDFKKRTYRPVLNKVDVDGIVAGKTAIIPFKDTGRSWVYGGHSDLGYGGNKKSDTRYGSNNPEIPMREAVKDYNEGVEKKGREDLAKVKEAAREVGQKLGLTQLADSASALAAPFMAKPKNTTEKASAEKH